MILRTWTGGPANDLFVNDDGMGCVEIELKDGRTAQLTMNQGGEVTLRTWGNIPIKIGNVSCGIANFVVQCKDATHCECCLERLDSCRCKI